MQVDKAISIFLIGLAPPYTLGYLVIVQKSNEFLFSEKSRC